ncbi:MAG: alkaline phosphatase [Candidatus Heimdallarchaeota archaeon]|nr:alkaline phosphatase [Candidatus Heimdallarchaeota archaeon]
MKSKELLMIIIIIVTPISFSQSVIINQSSNQQEVKNIILLIGDGMGFSHLELGSLVEYGNNNSLFLQSNLLFQQKMSTNEIYGDITDSASSATAMATGYNTRMGKIGVLLNDTPVQTILEKAELMGKKTGIVTTTDFTHATPAAFAAHTSNREHKESIYQQMINQGIEIILAGGQRWISDVNTLINLNYSHITTIDELDTNTDKIFGTFNWNHLEYESDLQYSQDARLTELTVKALNHLSNQENGFFLMIEGGRIDHAGHEGNLTRNALEVIEIDRTAKIIHDWMLSNPNTLFLVVADHETGGLTIGNNHILDDNLPSNFINLEDMRDRRIDRVAQIDATYSSSSHFPWLVPLIGIGEVANSLMSMTCSYSNTNVFDIMNRALTGNIINDCPPPAEILPKPTYQPYSPTDDNKLSLFSPLFLFAILVLSSRLKKRFNLSQL